MATTTETVIAPDAVIEQAIPWRERPGERKRQLEWQWSSRSSRVWDAKAAIDKRVALNEASVKKTKDIVDGLLKEAYEALLEAVKALLNLSDGEDPVDRSTAQVVPSLDLAITRFKDGETKTAAEAKKLIDAAGACMNDGDIIEKGVRVLKDWEKTLGNELGEVSSWVDSLYASSRAKKRTLLELWAIPVTSEQTVEQQYDDFMIRRREKIANGAGWDVQILRDTFPTQHTEAKRAGRLARRGLGLKNEMNGIRTRIQEGQFTLQTITDRFHDQHKVMQTAWEGTTKIWQGLFRLKSDVEDDRFKTTRDSSLKQILTLIKEDDVKLEASWPAARTTENSIYAEINGKLGDGAVQRIVEGDSTKYDSPY